MNGITNAFVIRPFGEKKGVNFDDIHEKLIAAALGKFGVKKTTTLDILRSGNIRADMFRLLLTADLVIADLSIHNANVFYELGIRHSLVKKHTILLRAPVDDFPFDLFTDHYLRYDAKNAVATLPELIKTIDETLNTTIDTDSPVFLLLPGLMEQDAEAFIVVPPRFSETVREIAAAKPAPESQIADLLLLAADIDDLPWEIAGLRLIGTALFQLKAHEAAREIWERIRTSDPNDIEANQWLSTIYQRLGAMPKAETAADRVLRHPRASKKARSEALALRARNAKREWMEKWSALPTLAEKREAALTSDLLAKACKAYHDAYLLELTNFYPGLNALGCALLLVKLAEEQPELWSALHKKPERELEPFREMVAGLPGSVRTSIAAALAEATPDGRLWAEVSLADLDLYCGESPKVVALGYRRKTEALTPFMIGAVRDQIEIFQNLGVCTDAATAALDAMKAAKTPPQKEVPHVILFTGHRVDDPDRKTPRFPESKVAAAAQQIEDAIDKIVKRKGTFIGVGGAASGGDILFHEALRRRGIETEIYLALPPDLYARESVQPSGGDWHDRFHALIDATPPRILQETKELPQWLFDKKDSYTVWERSNLWMLGRAMVNGGRNMSLLALWNGQSGDGPGGTKDMVERAKKRGAKFTPLGQGTIF